MTYEALAVFAVIAAGLAGYALWLKSKLKVALAREEAEIPTIDAISDESARQLFRRQVREYQRVRSEAILVSADPEGGVIVAPAPHPGR
jgi:hypothetical protein